ncbi:MAG: protease complex subunit PrcB family protein [Flavobacterium sp.]|nr:protease complex subunit PrcB family protein [Flavobacterium sp.]
MKKILIPLNLFFTFNKKLLLTFTTFFILISCTSNDDESSSSFTPQNILFTLIGKSFMIDNTPFISQQNTVITNQTQWDNMLNQLNPNLWGDPLVTTSIDFNSFYLIVVIDSVRPDTGFLIEITEIVEYENNIRVTINRSYGGSGYTVFSQPFHIVKIPIQSKPFVFH